MNKQAALEALQWYADHGIDDVWSDTPQNRLLSPPQTIIESPLATSGLSKNPGFSESAPATQPPVATAVLGTQEAVQKAIALANAANTIEELRAALSEFDGLSVRKTATNMVFSDGNPQADVMLIGEAPGADEDRQGKPFVGVSGQLLDKILACINLDRTAEDPDNAIYISNILNWRPPGNRTPTPQEVNISLPFIEKHICLIKPKIIILCGGVAAKALLYSNDSVTKLRKGTYVFTPRSGITVDSDISIPAITTYHPAYLLRTPLQKRAVWMDMLKIEENLQQIRGQTN